MPILREYLCAACEQRYEFLHHPADEQNICPSCGSIEAATQAGGQLLVAMIPTYKHCKRQKAGFLHSHGDKPAEKTYVAVPRGDSK